MLDLKSMVDESWTLFLDRDGVLNRERENDYVKSPEEFHWYDGVCEAVASLSKVFSRIVVVTNQKGIGKKLMSANDLINVHAEMIRNIHAYGGKIDKIYYCPDLDDNSPNRKPQPGMAYQAKEDFPDIEFDKSVMIGNRDTDMMFARNAGMKTIFVATTHPEVPFPNPLIDLRFDNLVEVARYFGSLK